MHIFYNKVTEVSIKFREISYLQLMVQKRGTQRAIDPDNFGKFGGALNTIYLFGCLRGGLIVSKVWGGVLVSSALKLLATLMGPIVSLRTWSSRTLNRRFYCGTFLNFYRNIWKTFLNNNRAQYLGNKMWRTQTPKLKKIRMKPNILDECNF